MKSMSSCTRGGKDIHQRNEGQIKGTDEIWKYKEGKPILIVEAQFKYFIIYLSSLFLQIPTSSLRGVTENKELRTETATSKEFSTSNRWSNSKIFPSVKRSQPWRRCFCTACLTASGESFQTGKQCTLQTFPPLSPF